MMMRIFVAIGLPEHITHSIGEMQEEMMRRLPSSSVRWVHPDNIHLTLNFIGEIPERSLDEFKSAFVDGVGEMQRIPVHVSGFGCFPNCRRPKVLWLGVEDASGRLKQMQRNLEKGFEMLGITRENRPFKPHLTLGRVKRQDSDLIQGLAQYKAESIGLFEVREVTLFQSELRPTGAVYTSLARAELDP
jgi:2'-5' RNA ligase